MPATPRNKPAANTLTAEQKREILNDPALKEELLNSAEGKKAIESLVSSEQVAEIITKKVEERVGNQTRAIPDSMKQYGFVEIGPRSYQMVEV